MSAAPGAGLRALAVLLRKDLLLQWRERAQGVAILAFGGAALLPLRHPQQLR